MRALVLVALILSGCAGRAAPGEGGELAAAERVISAFYSFDRDRLRNAMAGAEASMPAILFYQGWAEGGNYVVLERKRCQPLLADKVSCDITVRDDFIQALGTGYDVTDTFTFTFENGRLNQVETSSNDPPQFQQALEWVRRERPELLEGPCKGFFAGGPTPQDCARAIVDGFRAYTARPPRR